GRAALDQAVTERFQRRQIDASEPVRRWQGGHRAAAKGSNVFHGLPPSAESLGLFTVEKCRAGASPPGGRREGIRTAGSVRRGRQRRWRQGTRSAAPRDRSSEGSRKKRGRRAKARGWIGLSFRPPSPSARPAPEARDARGGRRR